MEAETAILEFVLSVWKMQKKLENYTNNKHASIKKSILLYLETHNNNNNNNKQAIHTSTKQCPKQTEDITNNR